MSRWLALYLNLVGHPPLTDGDTSRHTGPCVKTSRRSDRSCGWGRSLTHGAVCRDVSLSVSPSIPLFCSVLKSSSHFPITAPGAEG